MTKILPQSDIFQTKMKTFQRRRKAKARARSNQVQTDLPIRHLASTDEHVAVDQSCYLPWLPVLVLYKIIMLLGVPDILSLSSTSKDMCINMSRTHFGRRYVMSHFPPSFYVNLFLNKYTLLEPKMFAPYRDNFWDIWYHNIVQVNFACTVTVITTNTSSELTFYSQRLLTALRKAWRGRLTYNWQTLHNLIDRAVVAHAKADMFKLKLHAMLLGTPFPYLSKYPEYFAGPNLLVSGRDPLVQGPATMRYVESQYRKYSLGKASSNLIESLFWIHPLVTRSYLSLCKTERHQWIVYCLSSGDFTRMFPEGLPDGTALDPFSLNFP